MSIYWHLVLGVNLRTNQRGIREHFQFFIAYLAEHKPNTDAHVKLAWKAYSLKLSRRTYCLKVLCVFFILCQSVSVCLSRLIKLSRKGKENGILRKYAKTCSTGHCLHMAAAAIHGCSPLPCHHLFPLRNECQYLLDGHSP